jgi:hypothetical protein
MIVKLLIKTTTNQKLITFASSANFYIYFAKYGRRPSFSNLTESRKHENKQQHQPRQQQQQQQHRQHHPRRPRLESVESHEICVPTETMSGNGFSTSSESTLRRHVTIANSKKVKAVMQQQQQQQIIRQISIENEIQTVPDDDDECTCNLRSIIIHHQESLNIETRN